MRENGNRQPTSGKTEDEDDDEDEHDSLSRQHGPTTGAMLVPSLSPLTDARRGAILRVERNR